MQAICAKCGQAATVTVTANGFSYTPDDAMLHCPIVKEPRKRKARATWTAITCRTWCRRWQIACAERSYHSPRSSCRACRLTSRGIAHQANSPSFRSRLDREQGQHRRHEKRARRRLRRNHSAASRPRASAASVTNMVKTTHRTAIGISITLVSLLVSGEGLGDENMESLAAPCLFVRAKVLLSSALVVPRPGITQPNWSGDAPAGHDCSSKPTTRVAPISPPRASPW